jgi:predicted SprT family Zn-dependent metalloprotease
MLVYSKKIIKFIEFIKSAIKEILSKELRLKVARERFYSADQRYSYPIKVVIYNNRSMLGYFDSDFYELGFHERLMGTTKEQLYNIIRHELAHYLAFLKYGRDSKPHGWTFKHFCQSVGWGEDVSAASVCLEEGDHSFIAETSSTFRKIQKLMALATSSNQNEAELAMIKSQQLLLKHNVELKSLNLLNDDDDEKIFLKRILKQKKSDAKMQAIAKILNTFFVNTVYNHCQSHTHLEIVGSLVNLEIADYVAGVLQHELDRLWDQARKQHSYLRGLVAKNSFFLGIAKGYCLKIEALKHEYTHDVNNALVVIEKKLLDAEALIYSGLTRRRSSRQFCPDSSNLGEQMGKKLNFNPAVGRAQGSGGLIGFNP